jgi:enolase-phosphatase E1
VKLRLLDIEGTVCPVSFVKDTLFPYARARLAAFVAANDVRAELAQAAAEGGLHPADRDGIVRLLLRWIDEDRKATPLKALQGRIWAEGWDTGAFVAPLYPEVAPTLRRWRAAGEALAVFSSGSVAAQRQLFGHTSDGDLTGLFAGYFDTTTGPKRSPSAYHAIARALERAPGDVHFYSDSVEELDAAAEAGCATTWVVRDGALPAHGIHGVRATLE